MGKSSTIDAFFKRKNSTNSEVTESLPTSNVKISDAKNYPNKSSRVDINDVDIKFLERDPRLHPQIWEYHVDQCDEI